jgi:hypothetical protein
MFMDKKYSTVDGVKQTDSRPEGSIASLIESDLKVEGDEKSGAGAACDVGRNPELYKEDGEWENF